MKVIKISDKEVNKFGVGLAKAGYPFLRIVGSKDSVGMRGDAKIFINDVEEKVHLTGEKPPMIGSVIGVGFETRSNKVFFTLNGREIFNSVAASRVFEGCGPHQIYPTFSMGSLEDKIQVNFGQTQFLFNLKSKLNVSSLLKI